MESLRLLLQRIQAQLAVMTKSQQLAIGLCAAVIVVSLLWLGQWSTKPQLEPLLDQPMNAKELGEVIAQLDAMGEEYEEIGDRLFVNPKNRHRLYRELMARDALPQDTSMGFANLLKDQSPFQPESMANRNFRIALQNELATTISSSPLIKHATVFINDARQRRIGAKQALNPTASVDLISGKAKAIDQQMVISFANMVSGAVAGLEPHRVKISVDGRPRKVPGPEDQVSFGLLEEQKKREHHLEEKIYAQLNYIPGVRVAVSVELETTRRTGESYEYTSTETKMDKTKTQESSNSSPANEPGLSPNTGTALAGGSEGTSTSTEDATTEFFAPELARTEKWNEAALTMKKAWASVHLPRSYFVNVFMAQNPEASSPTNKDLEPLIDVEKVRVKGAVQNVLGTSEPGFVQVDWFPDLAPDAPGKWRESPLFAGATADDEDPSTMGTITAYAPQLGMGGLALVSLAMMFMLVRKSSRAINILPPEIALEEEPEEYTPLENANLTEGFLTGQEVDEETLRYKNYTDQVSKMVDEDPEVAAELVRRWMEQG